MSTQGQILIFTGDGKGKTSAALGTAVRALGHGWSVVWVAFYKEASWGISEFALPQLLQEAHQNRFHIAALGKGFYVKKAEKLLHQGEKTIKLTSAQSAMIVDDNTPDEHQAAAQAALEHARQLLLEKKPQVLVLDEVCNALDDGLLAFASLKAFLQERGSTHIVLTGRNAPDELIEQADLVSKIEKIKHPYDQGQLAVKGLDF